MAILTFSRQYATNGDRIARAVAEKLGYSFFCGDDIRKKIISMGFSQKFIMKYDNQKTGFFMNFTKERDQYYDCLRTVILELAESGNCVILGRGAFSVLRDVKNHWGLRVVGTERSRVASVMAETGVDEASAKKIIYEDDRRQRGFHKNYFGVDIDDPSNYDMIVNGATVDEKNIASGIAEFVDSSENEEIRREGRNQIGEKLIGQRIVNILFLDYEMGISELRVDVEGDEITLHGIADSSALIKRAVELVACELPEYRVKSDIQAVQDFRGGIVSSKV